jgi:hypothetical protein
VPSFPPALIAHAVWLYFRFPSSLRLIEEMVLERGIIVSYETIRCLAKNFGRAGIGGVPSSSTVDDQCMGAVWPLRP